VMRGFEYTYIVYWSRPGWRRDAEHTCSCRAGIRDKLCGSRHGSRSRLGHDESNASRRSQVGGRHHNPDALMRLARTRDSPLPCYAAFRKAAAGRDTHTPRLARLCRHYKHEHVRRRDKRDGRAMEASRVAARRCATGGLYMAVRHT